jgi:hypothetical protein
MQGVGPVPKIGADLVPLADMLGVGEAARGQTPRKRVRFEVNRHEGNASRHGDLGG